MQRPVIAGCNERQGNRCRQNAGQFLFGLLGRFSEPLQGLAVSPQIHSVLFLKCVSDPIHDSLIEIIAAQLRVSVGGFDVEHAVRDPQQGYVKRAAPQVEDQHTTNGAAIKAVSQSGSRGFIENPLDGNARQASGVTGGLTLGVVEISRNRDHSRFDGFP